MEAHDRVEGALDRGPTRAIVVWRILAGVATTLSVLVNVWIAWGARTISFPYDEVDTLLVGRIALGMPAPHTTGAGYYPGWSILLAPIWWFTGDPFTFYEIAMVVGLVVGAVTIWPLARVATRFGLTMAQGVTVAAVVMALPSRAVQSGFLLSERLVFLCVVLTVLAAFRLWERPTYLRAVLLAAAAAAALFSHARMLELVATTGLWLLLFLLRRIRVALVGLVVLGGLSWAADRLARHLNEILLHHPFTQDQHLSAALAQTRPGLLFRTGFGEAWMQLIGSFGVVAVGVAVGVALGWRELRARRVGPVCFVMGTALAAYLLSALVWATPYHLYTRPWRRLDTWIYGRYADPAVAMVTLIGLCAIVVGLRRAPVIWACLLALVVALPTVFVVSRDAPIWAFVTPAHIPGMLPWAWTLPHHKVPYGLVPTFTNANRFWLIATVTALVPLLAAVVSLLLWRRRPGLRAVGVTVVVLAMAVAGSVVANRPADRARSVHEVPAAVWTLRHLLAEHPTATVSFDSRCPRPMSRSATWRNLTMWWLLPTIVTPGRDGEMVVSCAHGEPSTVPGVARLPERLFGRDGIVWVMPGQLQDELRAEGAFSTSLDRATQPPAVSGRRSRAASARAASADRAEAVSAGSIPHSSR